MHFKHEMVANLAKISKKLWINCVQINCAQPVIHSCTNFYSAWTKEIDFGTWVLFWFFSFIFLAFAQSWSVWLNLFWSLGPLFLMECTKSGKILEKRYNLLPDNLNIQETFVSRRVFTTWTVIVIKICDSVHYLWQWKKIDILLQTVIEKNIFK